MRTFTSCRCALRAAALLLIPACSSNPFDQSISDAAAPLEARLHALSAQRAAPATTGGRSLPSSAPEGPLTLRQAMALALEHNPRLQAYNLDANAAEARALQAGLWENPELAIEVEGIAGSGEFAGLDAGETTLSLAQTFPLGGDVKRRQQLAGLQTQLANWDYETARLEVLRDVTQQFAAALAADRQVVLAAQNLEFGQATQRITDRRVAAGDLAPLEQARVTVPVVLAEVAMKRAERVRDAAYARLAANWGSPQPIFDLVQGDLEELHPPPAPGALVQMINTNPQVARWATEVSARLAERRLARAQAVPDLTGMVGVKHAGETDDTGLVVGVALPLPLFDRRQGDILATRFGEASARQRQREAELRLERMLSDAYADFASAYDEAIALREMALPVAERAVEATRLAFEEGGLPLLDVIDAQRTLFDLQQQYLDSLQAYHTAAAEIESLIGQRLSDLATPEPLPGDDE